MRCRFASTSLVWVGHNCHQPTAPPRRRSCKARLCSTRASKSPSVHTDPSRPASQSPRCGHRASQSRLRPPPTSPQRAPGATCSPTSNSQVLAPSTPPGTPLEPGAVWGEARGHQRRTASDYGRAAIQLHLRACTSWCPGRTSTAIGSPHRGCTETRTPCCSARSPWGEW